MCLDKRAVKQNGMLNKGKTVSSWLKMACISVHIKLGDKYRICLFHQYNVCGYSNGNSILWLNQCRYIVYLWNIGTQSQFTDKYMSRLKTKPTKWLCAQRRLRSAWKCAKSDQSLCYLHILSYLLSAQRRLGSDWVDAQADLSLRWAHTSFYWFCHVAAHM